MRPKLIFRKEIPTPEGPIIIEAREYPPYSKRSKVIYWMGEGKVVLLGHLTTVYRVKKRKSDFEKTKYEPCNYSVKITEDANASKVAPYFYTAEEEARLEGEYEFDDKRNAMRFVEGLQCKNVQQGGIFTGSKKEYETWKKVVEEVYAEQKEAEK